MIILDTNVISEPMGPAPNPRVLAWFDTQNADTLHLSAVTVGELRYGLSILPAGRRRDTLTDRLEQHTLPLFSGRILPYDLSSTGHYARLMSQARAAGRAIAAADGMIAATAAATGFTVATRDTSPFEAAGVPTINPWQ
ncbi:MAG: type II toxin-antitoxin system VapC family toxin [Nocardia sp.]|nr:type II toxin-antitoxin system VapC family toxin [Nocardia sp.]